MDITQQLISRKVRVRADGLFAVTPSAIIRAIDTVAASLLLEFVPPVQIGEVAYAFAVTSPRLERDGLETLLKEGVLGCGVTCIPPDRYNSEKPFDLSWWRGGGVAIADVLLQ